MLVLRRDRGEAARDRVMKAMATTSAAALGIPDLPPPASAERGVHRSYELPYSRRSDSGPYLRPSVLLEMGIRGGAAPLVHEAATELNATGDVRLPAGFGRHLYDVHELLGAEEVVAFLDDRGEFHRVSDETFAIGAEHFGARAARPEGGFAACPAFDGPAQGAVVRALARELDAARSLAFADAVWPSYDHLRSRVRALADRL